MKEILKKFYDIDIDDLMEVNDGVTFIIAGEKYYLTATDYDEEYLQSLNYLINELKQKKIFLHDLILNKRGKYNSDGYCLMKLNCFSDDITDYDLEKFYNALPLSLDIYSNYVFMDDLWYKKIDYLEYQVSELSDIELINNYFDYYIGVSEILLQFISEFKSDEVRKYIGLCHRKLKDFSALNFYNPLNIIFDIYTRDLALYVKENKDYDYLINFISKINFKGYDYYYLYVRLLFPYDYFDLLENLLLEKKGEKKFIQYLYRIEEYEEHIAVVSDIFGIHLFPWIKKSN